MPEDVNRIQELLEDINKSLSYTGEDGKVIHISEAFKTLPELAAKYGDLAARFEEMEKKTRERKHAGVVRPGGRKGKVLPVQGHLCHRHRGLVPGPVRGGRVSGRPGTWPPPRTAPEAIWSRSRPSRNSSR